MAVTNLIQACDVQFAVAFQFSLKNSAKSGADKWDIDAGLPWDCNDPASIKFAEELDRSFNGRAKTYTNLSSGSKIKNSLAHQLECFKNIKTPTKANFTDAMSTFITHHLKGELNNSQLKTGFIVTAVLYEAYTSSNGSKVAGTEKKILNISMIRASEALQFDNDYRITKVPAIDFTQLLQSARIDLTIFASNLSANSDDVHSDMSFIAGQGGVRDYFFEGLGAQDYIKNKLAADNLLDGLESFLDSINLSRDEKLKIKDNMHAFLASSKNKEGVLIDNIESHLDSYLPASHAKYKGEFKQHLTSNNYEVNETVVFSPEQRNRLVWISLDINDIQMKFRLEDIGRKGSSSPLNYDAATDTLSFQEKITDKDVIAAIKRALKG